MHKIYQLVRMEISQISKRKTLTMPWELEESCTITAFYFQHSEFSSQIRPYFSVYFSDLSLPQELPTLCTVLVHSNKYLSQGPEKFFWIFNIFSYGERFSMNKCIIYDVLDLDVSVSQKAVFKVCSPN